MNYNGNQIRRRKGVGHMLKKGNGSQEGDVLDWSPQRRSRGRLRRIWKRTTRDQALKESKIWKEVKRNWPQAGLWSGTSWISYDSFRDNMNK
jgi:hypothetical protein